MDWRGSLIAAIVILTTCLSSVELLVVRSSFSSYNPDLVLFRLSNTTATSALSRIITSRWETLSELQMQLSVPTEATAGLGAGSITSHSCYTPSPSPILLLPGNIHEYPKPELLILFLADEITIVHKIIIKFQHTSEYFYNISVLFALHFFSNFRISLFVVK